MDANWGIAALGFSGVIIAAILRIPWKRNCPPPVGDFVSDDLCKARVEGIEVRINGLESLVTERMDRLDDAIRELGKKEK